MNLLKQAVVLGIATTMFACGESPTSQKPEKHKETTEEVDVMPEIEDDEEMAVVFPSAIEIMDVFKSAGLKYLDDVTNGLDRAKEYGSTFQKSIGVGIYTTDLAYSVLNNQNQKAIDYMDAVTNLSEDIGIVVVSANDDIAKRFEASLGDNDAVFDVMTEIQELTDDYLEVNDMGDEGALIFSGAWLEGMYIGVKANDDYSKSKVSQRVAEQMRILDNLLKVLKKSKNQSAEVKEYLAKLESLNTYYYSLDEVSSNEYGFNLNLSVEQLKEIAGRIVELRNSLV